MTKQEEVSIKVHCIVSCLCEVIREQTKLDYRPFYFGLWDAPYDVTESGEFTYYQHDLDHSHYFTWYERLFSAPVVEWYDKEQSKEANWEILLGLLEEDNPGRYVMVQIDLSLMPERDNKFHQKPFPHFLILQKSVEPDKWSMLDPDFRWRGIVEKSQVAHAFLQNSFGGGFYVDAAGLQEPSIAAIDDYFQQVFTFQNGLTASLQTWIPRLAEDEGRLTEEEGGLTGKVLELAVRQLPVLAIRKYSYEHALMYFMEETGASDEKFEYYCDLIEEIVQGFHNIQYMAMKMSMSKKANMLTSVLGKLADMDRVETLVKQELNRLYQQWREQHSDHNRLTCAVERGLSS